MFQIGSHDYMSTLCALYVTDRGYFQNSVLSLCQALLIRRRRMEYYVIKVSFCREFQTSFFQAHHLSPRTFFYQFLFDVVLENTIIRHRLGIHAGILETRRLDRVYCHSNLFMQVGLFSVL